MAKTIIYSRKEVIILHIQFDIPDSDLTHFSQEAKNRLTEQAKVHTLEIIQESNRVEGMYHTNGASQEITESMVVQAIDRNKIIRKKKIGIILLKILSEVLVFLSGLLFIPEWFIKPDNSLNLVYTFFIITLMGASLGLTIAMHFKDGE